MTETLHINLAKRSYDILVGDRLLAKAARHIAPLIKGSVIIVSDENVAKFYLHRLTGSLEEAGIRYRSIIVPAGEGTKSLLSFSNVIEQILEQKPDRKTTLIALGGGVVGDLTGFAASTLLRGVEFIQIPTTLLALVDSSVGGKTGINSAHGKNLIGAFHQPVLVLSDVATLSTLPRRELLAGYAEMLKYALINDPAFFSWLDDHGEKMLAGDTPLLTSAIVHCCKAKAAIVEADEKENNIRALLNLGHTFAHAFEAETGYGDTLLHGEAVAIGMVLAFETSVAMGLCAVEDLAKIKAHYAKIGLPASVKDIRLPSPPACGGTKGGDGATFSAPSGHPLPNPPPQAGEGKEISWNIKALMEHFTHDKKTVDGALTFILARGIGKAFVANNVDKGLIREILASSCGEPKVKSAGSHATHSEGDPAQSLRASQDDG